MTLNVAMVAFKHLKGLFVFALKDLYSKWMAKHAQVSNVFSSCSDCQTLFLALSTRSE